MTIVRRPDFEAAVAAIPPREAALWGFRSGDGGTHTSRTIMVDDLMIVLESVPPGMSRNGYADAIRAENCLGKRTVATRTVSQQRLKELYALDPQVLLFRVLRQLWEREHSDLPLLAMLLALARDPLLRATAAAVLDTPYGHEFSRQPMKDALSEVVGDRLNEETLDKTVRYASSSWTQSGHLSGRGRKTRVRVRATPTTTTYALMLGFVAGKRGRQLFETPWCVALDGEADELIELSLAAKRLGLLDLRQSGSMIDVAFPKTMIGAGR